MQIIAVTRNGAITGFMKHSITKPKTSTSRKKSAAKKAPQSKAGGTSMWGGHFSVGPAEAFAKINPSIEVDARLWREDIEGSIAHASMLSETGIISAKEARSLTKGLKQIAQEMAAGQFQFSAALEDIHMNIEARLKDIIGEVAGKLHTARSRNDQVATDVKLYTRRHVGRIIAVLHNLRQALIALAENHTQTIMPGMTHLQPAQPVSFAFYVMAYETMFTRDMSRLEDALIRLDTCPLGSAALAGTSYPINRKTTAKALGFTAVTTNAMDAVSDRDFALEIIAATSIIAMHLSRLAEELIFFSNPLVGYVKLDEGFTSGSSIMPQKRNADAAELIRGKTGAIAAQFQSLLTTMKALPLAYNKDMQEDKRPLFLALDETELCLSAMCGMVQTLKPQPDAMRKACALGYLNATDLADYLVQTHDLPFRKAHHITGKIVKLAEKKQVALDDLSLKQMQQIFPELTQSVFRFIALEACMKRRKSEGGTAPLQVKRQIKRAQKSLHISNKK
jgi:argininosuccinate lyase